MYTDNEKSGIQNQIHRLQKNEKVNSNTSAYGG